MHYLSLPKKYYIFWYFKINQQETKMNSFEKPGFFYKIMFKAIDHDFLLELAKNFLWLNKCNKYIRKVHICYFLLYNYYCPDAVH